MSDRRIGVYGDAAIKFPCRVATTANSTLDGLLTIDGVVLSAGDRVLVRAQSNSVDNGIYVADTGYWTRAVDFDGIRDVAKGSLIAVNEGGSFAGSVWALTTADIPVVGFSAITFAQTPNGTIADNGYVRVSQFGTGMAALKAAVAASKKVHGTPGETYTYAGGTDQIFIDGVDCDISLPFCTVHRASNTSAPIRINGGWEEEQTFTPTAAGATVLAVQDGTKYAVGQDLKVISDDAIPTYSDEAVAGEFVVVRSISVNNLTLGGPLLHAYTTNPRVARIKATTVKLDIGAFTVQSGTSGRLIFMEACKGAFVHVGRSPYLSGAVLAAQGCLGCSILVDYHAGGPASASFGYGVQLACSEKCRVQVTYAGPTRHVIDMGGGNDGSSAFSNSGLSAYNVGHDSFGTGSGEATFATHHATYRNVYQNCGSQFSAGSGIALRGTRNGAENFRSFQDVQGVSSFNESSSIAQTTTGTWFRNLRIIDPTNFFAATSAGSLEIEGAYCERTQNDNQNGLFSATAGDLMLTNSHVRVTTGSLDDRIVLANTGCARVTIAGTTFDLRGVNLSNDLVLAENISGATDMVLSDVDVIADEGMQLIRIAGTLGTGSLFRDISLPASSTLCNTIGDHLLWKYVRGGISIGLFEMQSAGRGINFTLADDTAIAIPFTGCGIFNIACFSNPTDAAPSPNGSFLARTSVSATAICSKIALADSTSVDFTTATVLTGTTGTDGHITIGAHAANDMIYIENRAGSSRSFALSITVMASG